MRAQAIEYNVFATADNRLRCSESFQLLSQGKRVVKEIGETLLLRTPTKQRPRFVAKPCGRESRSCDLRHIPNYTAVTAAATTVALVATWRIDLFMPDC